MQITIAQSEIETAIRNYILGQITVRESQRIDIDLRATRGPEGFQAFIDIRPENDPEPTKRTEEAAPAEKPAPVKKQTVTASASGSTKSVFAKTKIEKPVEEPTPISDEKAEETALVEETTMPEVPFETESKEETKAEEAPARSIFSNLRKPVNQAVA